MKLKRFTVVEPICSSKTLFPLLTVGGGVRVHPAPLCTCRVCFTSVVQNGITARVFRFPQSSNSFNCIHSTCSRTPAWTHTAFPWRCNTYVCVCMCASVWVRACTAHAPPDRDVCVGCHFPVTRQRTALPRSAHLCARACINTCVCVRRCASVDSVPLFVRAQAFRTVRPVNTNNDCAALKRN